MDGGELGWALLDSPCGKIFAAATPRGTCRTSWDVADPQRLANGLAEDLGAVSCVRDAEVVAETVVQLERWFGGRPEPFQLELFPDPTAGPRFRARVLRAAAAIPVGETRTYSQIAAVAGSPRAARAAGSALGSNPLPIIVPCHRVIATDGRIGGFSGGLDRKRILLGIEGTGPMT